jgi:hypothetical protein
MAHCPHGLPDFHGLRSGDGGAAACLFAFDLLRLNGEDLRPLPLKERRARLRKALRGSDKGAAVQRAPGRRPLRGRSTRERSLRETGPCRARGTPDSSRALYLDDALGALLVRTLLRQISNALPCNLNTPRSGFVI